MTNPNTLSTKKYLQQKNKHSFRFHTRLIPFATIKRGLITCFLIWRLWNQHKKIVKPLKRLNHLCLNYRCKIISRLNASRATALKIMMTYAKHRHTTQMKRPKSQGDIKQPGYETMDTVHTLWLWEYSVSSDMLSQTKILHFLNISYFLLFLPFYVNAFVFVLKPLNHLLLIRRTVTDLVFINQHLLLFFLCL